MKCPHCEYEGRARKIYFSAFGKNMHKCVKCGEIFNSEDLPRIKGYCTDCEYLVKNELGVYCYNSLEDIKPDIDYCSKFEEKETR